MWFVRIRLHRFVRLTFRPPWKEYAKKKGSKNRPLLNFCFPEGNKPQQLEDIKDLILKDSWPLFISNSAIPFLEKDILPLTNLVKNFFFAKEFLILALIGFASIKPTEKYRKGNTKNLKQAAEDIGFPGSPKKALLFLNFVNIIGFPGLM